MVPSPASDPHTAQRQTGKHTAFIETSSLQETPGPEAKPEGLAGLALKTRLAGRGAQDRQWVCSVLSISKKSAAWAETEQGPVGALPLLTSWGTRALI